MDKSNLIQYRRLLDLRGTIEQYERESINEMLIVYNRSIENIEKRLKKTRSIETKKQLKGILKSIEDAHTTFKAAINDSLIETVATTGKEMSKGMVNILSWDGKDKSFNVPANRVKKTLNAIENVPIGGKLLNEWVEKVFDDTLELQRQILSSDVAGEGYKKLYSRLRDTYPEHTRKELITLARTYNQSIIVDEQERLFKANSDIVEKVKWSAIMETGFSSSGRGTCPRCAALDGTEYEHNEEKPNCPLHARCRCMWVPVTVSWNDLFKKHDMRDKDGNHLTMDEMADDYQKFLNREESNIDVGRGAGNILNEEWTNKPYGEFITKRGGKDLENVVGPSRAKLIREGKIDFSDIVDKKTGELKTLKELGYPKVERSVIPKAETLVKSVEVDGGETFGVPLAGEFVKGLDRSLYTKYHAELLKRDASYAIGEAGNGPCCYWPVPGKEQILMYLNKAGTPKAGSTFIHEFGHRTDNIYANKFLSEGWGNKSGLPANRWASCSDKYVQALNEDFKEILADEEKAFKILRKGKRKKDFDIKAMKELKVTFLQDEFFSLYEKTGGTNQEIAEEFSKMKVKKSNRFLKDFVDSAIDTFAKANPKAIERINGFKIKAYGALSAYDKTGAKNFIVDELLNSFLLYYPDSDIDSRLPTYISDSICGTTLTRYGWGHTKDYMEKYPENRFVEPFANLFLLSEHKEARKIMELLMPNQLAVMDEFIKGIMK